MTATTGWPEVDLDYDGVTDGVVGVPAQMFWTYENLTEVKLPATVKALGCHAFRGTGLESFSSEHITHVGKYCFYECSYLQHVDLPAATTIGGMAFNDCTGLTTLSLPAATTLGENAFTGCNALQQLNLSAKGDMVTNNAFLLLDVTNCDLVLNVDKHNTTGTATPKATSATQWEIALDEDDRQIPQTWKSITFVE